MMVMTVVLMGLCTLRMVGCDLTYGLETVSNASIVENFLPSYRTFKIFPLRSNSTYWLYMTCKDRTGGWHLSDTITFTTGVATLLSSQPAAVQSELGSQQGLVETLNRGMLSVRPANNVSPHTIMGKFDFIKGEGGSKSLYSVIIIGVGSGSKGNSGLRNYLGRKSIK